MRPPKPNDPRNRPPAVPYNKWITAPEVRLVGENGEMIGVVPLQTALLKAQEAGLDLVEIASGAVPPVCKIIDFGKFNFELEKKKKEARKNSKVIQNKEIRLRPKTDVHDYNFKLKHVREFLDDGDRVKVTVKFKGREMAYTQNGRDQIEKMIRDTADIGRVEVAPRMAEKVLSVTLVPIRREEKDKKDDKKEEKKDAPKPVAEKAPAPAVKTPAPAVP